MVHAHTALGEFGNPNIPQEFQYLYAYSPYHHIKAGTKYPAVLLTTGSADTNCDPFHACKMAARLQAASTSNKPILLRYETNLSHNPRQGTWEQQIETQTDELSFLFQQLGMTMN